LFRATSDKLDTSIKLQSDPIISGRTMSMMEQLRRLNDEKMRTAIKLASRLGGGQRQVTTGAKTGPVAVAENRPAGNR
jgi:hypothetical protein